MFQRIKKKSVACMILCPPTFVLLDLTLRLHWARILILESAEGAAASIELLVNDPNQQLTPGSDTSIVSRALIQFPLPNTSAFLLFSSVSPHKIVFILDKKKNHRNVIFIVCNLECSVLVSTVINHIWSYKYFYAFVNTVHIVLGLVGA